MKTHQMLRRLATWVLVLPLSLNGLWMVCAEEEPPEAQALSTADCTEMCPIQKSEEIALGAICIISSSGEGNSLTAIFFGVAPPPATASWQAEFQILESVTEQPEIYRSPSLAGLTPPPRA